DAGWRRALIALAVVLLVLVALVGLHVRGGTTPLRVDRAGSRIAGEQLGRLDSPQLLDKVVWLGSLNFVVPMMAATALWAWRRRDRFGMALSVVGPVVALVITEVIAKPLVDRTNGGALAYPSGHVTGATAIATVAVLLAYRHWGRDRALQVAVVASLVPLAVGVGVVRLGWHYATDAAGGAAVGVAAVLATAVVLARFEDRRTGAAAILRE
ncbi:MAG: putative rane protein, partial [Acidimicrobiales bacterium]|nr:putative rane protein [Acidimicrobiales bacterium]